MDQHDAMRQGFMDMNETLAVIYEWGEGQKATLIARGWSVGAAESIATELVKSYTATQLRSAKT